MVRRVLYSAAFVLVVMVAGSAVAGNWYFQNMYTLDPVSDSPYDGTFYLDNGGAGHGAAVQSGAFAQWIIGVSGADIVDPLDYFDANDNGQIDSGAELTAVTSWVNDGADPSDLDSNNVLITGSQGFTGEMALTSAGKLDWSAGEPNPLINVGLGQDYIALRVWNLTKTELENFCTVEGQEIWYITDREMGAGGGRDTGWSVGCGSVAQGADPAEWTFGATMGVEAYINSGYNELDQHLGTCPPIPEPGTMLLIGSAALLLLVRRKK